LTASPWVLNIRQESCAPTFLLPTFLSKLSSGWELPKKWASHNYTSDFTWTSHNFISLSQTHRILCLVMEVYALLQEDTDLS